MMYLDDDDDDDGQYHKPVYGGAGDDDDDGYVTTKLSHFDFMLSNMYTIKMISSSSTNKWPISMFSLQ